MAVTRKKSLFIGVLVKIELGRNQESLLKFKLQTQGPRTECNIKDDHSVQENQSSVRKNFKILNNLLWILE